MISATKCHVPYVPFGKAAHLNSKYSTTYNCINVFIGI